MSKKPMATAPKKPQKHDPLDEFAREVAAELNEKLKHMSPEEVARVDREIAKITAAIDRRGASGKQ